MWRKKKYIEVFYERIRESNLAEYKLGWGQRKINPDKWVSIHHLFNK